MGITGEIKDAPGLIVVRINAVDAHERLPGGFFLLHRGDAQMMGDDTSKGIEIIGYDFPSRTVLPYSFDKGTHGPLCRMECGKYGGTPNGLQAGSVAARKP